MTTAEAIGESLQSSDVDGVNAPKANVVDAIIISGRAIADAIGAAMADDASAKIIAQGVEGNERYGGLEGVRDGLYDVADALRDVAMAIREHYEKSK